MPSHVNTIYLLVGPKGAGKTHLATRMENELAVPFLRVEPIWLKLSTEMASSTPAFNEKGLRLVIAEARQLLRLNSRFVLESTGTAPWFPEFLEQLKALGKVVLIGVQVPLETCLRRIHARDASKHIAVSDDRISEINQLASKLELPWEAVVENTSIEKADEFIEMTRTTAFH